MAYSDLDAIHVASAGNRPPASWGVQVNANFDAIYDDVLAKLGVWTTFSSGLIQSGAPTFTSTYCRYLKLGRMVIVSTLLTVTATGSAVAGNAVQITLPFTAVQASNLTVGVGHIYDNSAALSYPGRAVLNTTTTARLQPTNVTSGGYLGVATFTAALAGSDTVDMTFTYEATS